MGMVDIQRRHKEVFRVRFGEKIESNGKVKPQRLTDAIRITSENPEIVDAFVAVYGGERVPWETTKWEAKLPTSALRVVLLPGQSMTQAWEKYAGSVCERRCNGVLEEKSGRPCEEMSPACSRDVVRRTANRNDCSPTTRVSILCPDVDVIGAGMFICHGLIGAETLPQSVQQADAALRLGFYVPAVVRVVEMIGKGTKFIVPVIEITGVSYNTMIEAAERKQLEGPRGGSRILGGQTAIAELDAATAPPTVRDQINAIDTPPAPSTRKNAAEPIPSSGLTPRTADEAGQGVIDVDGEEDEDSSAVQLIPAADDGGGPGALHVASGPPTNRVAIACREAGMDDDERHMLAAWASEGRTASSKDLTDVEVGHALIAAANVRDGRARIREVDGNIVLTHATFGWPVPRGRELGDDDPESGSGDPSTVSGMPALSAAEIMAMKGQQVNEQLRDRGLQLGGTVPEMKQRLMDALGVSEEPF